MSSLLRRVAAVVCVSVFGTAMLVSCGSSGDEPIGVLGPTPELDQTNAAVSTRGPTAVATAVSAPDPTPEAVPIASGVGYFEATFVDHLRPTPRSGNDPGRDSRKLRTMVFYPAATVTAPAAPIKDAPPAAGLHPLVLFAHGLGSLPDSYFGLLSTIADNGYVVAAPEFPLTSANSPSSPDPRDTASQPGDLSFLIDAIAERASDPQWPLFGLVDSSRIAATGHSNGAVTVLGISANSCCRDERIDVVVAMAGPAADFNGEYDFTETPPILFVHGTEDSAIVYEASARMFNQVSAIKGLLTLNGGDHHTWRSPGHEFFADVSTTVLDFLALVLKSDQGAVARLEQPRISPNAELAFAAEADSGLAVEVESVTANRSAWAEPSSGLVDGQTVLVRWSGYLPGQTVNVVQCSQGAIRDSAACDFTHAKILHPNPTGEGSVELVVIAGPVGNGVCDASVDDCVIAVNDSGILEPEATVRIPIGFSP